MLHETSDGSRDLSGFETQRLELRLLGAAHEALLQHVFERGGDYFLRVTGTPAPDAGAAARELRACAETPGREVALLTLRVSGEPAGALGWWRGNPEPEIALLGMLLLLPEHRRQGLAREALGGLGDWLLARGVRRLRTASVATSGGEHALLRALGFGEMSIRDHAALGLGGAHFVLFEKPLVSA